MNRLSTALRHGRRTSVVLTGFGPFPGVPLNATMLLIPQLAAAARGLFPAIDVTTEILATEWIAAPARVDALIATHAPDLLIHFGVASAARGFEIERQGRNACDLAPDASGRLPDAAHVRPSGPDLHASRLPVDAIVHRLRAHGIPAFASLSAGAYLCNATLYHSLAETDPAQCHTGFVHIPASLAPAVAPAPGAPLRTSAGCPLTWAQALEGGLHILATCLDLPSPEPQVMAQIVTDRGPARSA